METAHGPLTEVGEKEAVAPAGKPDKLSCTVPANPFEPTLTAVYVVLPPCKIVPVLGRPLTAKPADWANTFVTARSINANAAAVDLILNRSDIASLPVMSCRFDLHHWCRPSFSDCLPKRWKPDTHQEPISRLIRT
ncbi:hypothetical protein Y046_6317 [Burkholderia pseudomallei MSHR2990]|nr:hypothetical protein Y046_6317 [Burkholderia pseudomallei MSHR2990]